MEYNVNVRILVFDGNTLTGYKGKNMKIIYRGKYKKEKLEISVNANSEFMQKVSREEDAKKEKAGIYINDKWQYVIGREIVNFVFLSVDAYTVYGAGEQIKEILYQIVLVADNEKIVVQISQQEYYSEKWLSELKVQNLLLISKRNYQKLIMAIKPNAKKEIIFDNIGFHRVDGKLYYVTSNCVITAEGINKDIKALQKGFDLHIDENIDEELCAKKFIEYNMSNLTVFYPIHCISIMAVLRTFLKEQGISAGVVLWIDGEPTSGKTHLAVGIGDFFNRRDAWDDKIKHLHSPKAKIKNVEKELLRYQNAVFILDDIKKEESVRNRENAKNVTDLLVRSIYMGRLGLEEDDTVNATAIITGEYFKEQISTVSRILYLNIGDFVQQKENSRKFKRLQRDKTYFADFMSYFIQWLIKKIEDGGYTDDFSVRMDEILDKLYTEFRGDLGTRIAEIVASFHFCTEVLIDYFKDIAKKELKIETINCFEVESKNTLISLGRATLNRSLDYRPVISDAFHKVLAEIEIKDCRYGDTFFNAMRDHFYYENVIDRLEGIGYELENGESIDTFMQTADKIALLGLEKDGVLLKLRDKEVLLLRTDVVCNRVRQKVTNSISEWNVSFYPSDYTDEKILANLLTENWLYAHKRDDGTFSKIIKYPTYEVDEKSISCKMYQVVKINMDKFELHIKEDAIQKLRERYEERKKINAFSSRLGSGDLSKDAKKIDDAIREVNKFIDLK